MKMRNIKALLAQFADDSTGNRGRPVGAVIEKLDMKLVARPIQRRGGSQAVRNHRGFVENRDLHQNMRKVGFAQNGRVKPLAEQPAGRLLENIDPDQNEKAAADEQEPAKGGKQADFASRF